MKKINEGYCAELFETEDSKLLKLYLLGWSEADVRQEYENTKAVNDLSVPSPTVFDFVEQGGRFGFVMEKLIDDTMLHHIQKKPLNAITLAKQMARLHHRIHSIPLDTHPFPAQKDVYLQKIQSRPSLTDAEKARLTDLLDTLANSDVQRICHGGFHPMNILYQGKQPVVIDWAYSSCGDPRGDVAGTYMITKLLATASAAHNRFERFLYNTFTPVFAEIYLKEYLKLSGYIKAEILQWVPIRAATYLDLGLPVQNNHKLRNMACGLEEMTL